MREQNRVCEQNRSKHEQNRVKYEQNRGREQIGAVRAETSTGTVLDWHLEIPKNFF